LKIEQFDFLKRVVNCLQKNFIVEFLALVL